MGEIKIVSTQRVRDPIRHAYEGWTINILADRAAHFRGHDRVMFQPYRMRRGGGQTGSSHEADDSHWSMERPGNVRAVTFSYRSAGAEMSNRKVSRAVIGSVDEGNALWGIGFTDRQVGIDSTG